MTVAIVDPTSSRSRTSSAAPWCTAPSRCVLVVVDLAVLAALTAALGDTLDQRQVVLTRAAADRGPVRPAAPAALARGAPADARRPRQPVRRRGRARLHPRDRRRGAGQLAVGRPGGGVGVRGRLRPRRGRPQRRRAAASRPTASGPAETRTLPITYRDAEVGRLVLPARGLRSRLSRRDEQLLGDLVRQAATAARTSRLADELQDSRERLVVAREEERRRIRRDLHDGLGPALSGVVFRLESARLLVDRDPEAAKGAPRRHQRPRAGGRRRRTPPGARPAPARARRPRAWSARCASRPSELSTDGLTVTRRGRRPRAAARGGRGGGVPHRRARRSPTWSATRPRASCVVRPGRRRRRRWWSRWPTTAPGSRRTAQAGVGLLSLRERAAELGGRSEVTCPADGRHRGARLAAPEAEPAGRRMSRTSGSSSPTTTRSSATGWSRCSARSTGSRSSAPPPTAATRCTWSTRPCPTSW